MSPRKGRKRQEGSIAANGSVIEGNVTIRNGTFVGRDSIVTTATTQNIFQPVYQAIEARPNTSGSEKDVLKSLIKDMEEEVKCSEPNERLMVRLFKDLHKMAPDILAVVITTLANPTLGLSLVTKKIIDKANQAVHTSGG